MKKIKVTYIASDRNGANVYESVINIDVSDDAFIELMEARNNDSKYRLNALVERLAELQMNDTFARAVVETVDEVVE